MKDLPNKLRIKASMIELGERIAWGSEAGLMKEAANKIEELEAELAAIMEQSTARVEHILRLEAEQAALKAQEPVATVTIQHFRQDPSMENLEFQLQAPLPQGTHKLYAAPQPVSDDAKDALVVALDALIADYDGEIHNEYDGTSMLDSRLSEINYAREALAAYRAAMEGSKGE